MYAHLFGVLVLVAHAIALVLVERRAAFRASWLRVAIALVLVSVPLAVLALHSGGHGIRWISPPTLETIAKNWLDFAGKSALVLVSLVIAGLIATVRAMGTPGWWRYPVLWAWLLLPNLLALVISIWQPVYLSYYLIASVPPLILLGAAGLAEIPSRTLSVATTTLLLTTAGVALVKEKRTPPPQDWRAAALYVLGSSQPGDAIVFLPSFASRPISYYERQSGNPGPEDQSSLRSWDRERVWLVARETDSAGNSDVWRRVRDSLQAHHHLADEHILRWISVRRYDR
jgi:hypothetical protein